MCCTPNGVVSFVSPLYVGGISDVELTWVSGLLDKLADKPGVSVMADRGFTIKDQLKPLNIELNIPPFMEGRRQLPAVEVRCGRRIAPLCIHVEKVIGRIKNFSILKSMLPSTMARIANQIVSVFSWLTNFQPALISGPCDNNDDFESVVESLYSSDYDADTELSDKFYYVFNNCCYWRSVLLCTV